MRFNYSPEVDILTVFVSEEAFLLGEDNEGVIVHHNGEGAPVGLEVMDATKFVLFANACLVTGQQITNPKASVSAYTKDRDVAVRLIPKGDADLRFKYNPGDDTLTVKLGEGASDLCRRNLDMSVYYDRNELPMGLEIANARRFVLGSIQSVLLHEEVRVA